MKDARFYRPARRTPPLGAMIAFADKTIFEIATDVISGTNRSTRKLCQEIEPRQCPRCGYFECICNTDAFKKWEGEQKQPDAVDIPAAPLDSD